MKIKIKKYVLPLKHTFSISRESHDFQDSMIVALELDGKTGYGEATSNPYYKITFETMQAEIEKVKEEIEGFQFREPEAFHAFLVSKNLQPTTYMEKYWANHYMKYGIRITVAIP